MAKKTIKGRDVVVSVGEAGGTLTRVTGSRDCLLRVTGEPGAILPVGGWSRSRGGLWGWSVTISGLWDVKGTSRLMDLQIAGTLVMVGMTVGTAVWSGWAYVTSVAPSGEVRGRVTYDIVLTGNGELDTGE